VSEEKLSKRDYWKLKKEDLIALLIEKEISFDPDNLDRKAAIEALVLKDAEAGILTQAVEINEETGEAGPAKIRQAYIDIVFHNQEGQPKYVFLGLNGQFLYLPRECLCRIPAEYLEVIKNAAETQLIQQESDGKMTYKEVRVPRLSFEVLERGVL
jgi:hypothetical protein